VELYVNKQVPQIVVVYAYEVTFCRPDVTREVTKSFRRFEMISEDQLNEYRVSGETVRVVRDNLESNDVQGIVVAWDDSCVMIRKKSRRVVKLSREYVYIAATEERPSIVN